MIVIRTTPPANAVAFRSIDVIRSSRPSSSPFTVSLRLAANTIPPVNSSMIPNISSPSTGLPLTHAAIR
jgi:hypothetical protein